MLSHDKGKTFTVIQEVLKEKLATTLYNVVDSRAGSTNAKRVLIAGFDIDRFQNKIDFNFDDLESNQKNTCMKDILHPEDGSEEPESHYNKNGPLAMVDSRYTLSPRLWKYLKDYAEKHRKAGNGFGYGLVAKPNDIARTLSARYYKDGSEVLVNRGPRKRPRRLTPRECARLMGFPDDFVIPVSDTQSYKQFGNSIAVPMVGEVARLMKPIILSAKDSEHRLRVVLQFFNEQES